VEPFRLIESSPGNFSLLLTVFEPASAVFARFGLEGGGYAWEGVAKHLVDHGESLEGRVNFDPEASMFCAYGPDRDALAELGARLATVFHAPDRLAELIEAIGPDGFDD
jgi:hypothetical protein